ncbi:MAG: hypothetical protein ACXU8O_08560, partial [Asticcacaulis sp.]
MGSLLPESVEVAAGLVFVYLFMSIVATAAREGFETLMRRRARNLEKGLVELLCNHPPEKGVTGAKKTAAYDMLKAFYDHPLIMTLYRGRYTIPPKRSLFTRIKLPSYIPSGHFAYVVLDLLAERGGQAMAGDLDTQTILEASKSLDNTRLARMIQFAVNNSGGNVDKTRQFLENWFNATMDRVSGWYRQETQGFLFIISLAVCVILNVNTVVIADSLYRSPSLRKAVEAAAETYYTHAKPETAADPSDVLANKDNPLKALGLPLGWNGQTIETMNSLFQPVYAVGPATPAKATTWKEDARGSANWFWTRLSNFYNSRPPLNDEGTWINIAAFITLIMGWAMTAFAVTLGAPFWFDILGKLITVRASMKPGGGDGTPINLGMQLSTTVPADGAPALTSAYDPGS